MGEKIIIIVSKELHDAPEACLDWMIDAYILIIVIIILQGKGYEHEIKAIRAILVAMPPKHF